MQKLNVPFPSRGRLRVAVHGVPLALAEAAADIAGIDVLQVLEDFFGRVAGIETFGAFDGGCFSFEKLGFALDKVAVASEKVDVCIAVGVGEGVSVRCCVGFALEEGGVGIEVEAWIWGSGVETLVRECGGGGEEGDTKSPERVHGG